MTIPIEDHKWHRIPREELRLPQDHYAEYARTGYNEIVVRIVGPHAHVVGTGPVMETAVTKAKEWFRSVGGYL